MEIKAPKTYFQSLDTLRFFAFFLVFFQHSMAAAFQFSENDGFFLKALRLLCNGALGVSFFFVLSGFLITYIILQEKVRYGKINVLYFYARRVLRIWPLYYAVLIFGLILYPAIRNYLGFEPFEYSYRYLMQFAFLSNFDMIYGLKYFPGHDSIMVTVNWSVSVEEQFYLVWPLLFILIPSRFYFLIFPAIILLSLGFRSSFPPGDIELGLHTFSAMNDLAIGGLGAYLVQFNKPFLELIKKMNRLVVVLVYLAGFFVLLNENYIARSALYPFTRIFESVFFIFIILEQNYCVNSFKKYGDWKVLRRLGTISYGLYLLHPICIQMTILISRYMDVPHNFYTSLFFAIISFIFSILLAHFSYHYFERHFLKLKDRLVLI